MEEDRPGIGGNNPPKPLEVSTVSPELEGRATITIDETAKILGICRNAAYEAAHQGQIPVIRIGRRMLVPRLALEKMLRGENEAI